MPKEGIEKVYIMLHKYLGWVLVNSHCKLYGIVI